MRAGIRSSGVLFVLVLTGVAALGVWRVAGGGRHSSAGGGSATSVPSAMPAVEPHTVTASTATTSTLPVPAVSASATAAVPAAGVSVGEADLIGTIPAIPGDLNANLRSVVEAARSGAHPERLTPLIAPAPYDHQRFLADPQAYVDRVEPGRVYQSAQPGEQVPQLDLVGDAVATIPQGAHTTLRVRTVAFAPTTFTSFECGAFANHLTSITVQADAAGIAAAVFTAPPGTLNEVTILAGSPLASGQVNFCVTVIPAVAQQAASGP